MLIPLRRRYMMTRQNTLRLRYYMPVMIMIAALSANFSTQIVDFGKSGQNVLLAGYEALPEAGTVLAALEHVSVFGAGNDQDSHDTHDSMLLAQDESVETLPMREDVSGSEEADVDLAMMPLPEDEASAYRTTGGATETTEHKQEAVTLASFYKRKALKEDNPVKIKIEEGQTVAGQLTEIGVPSTEAYDAVEALREFYDPRRIRPGQAFEVEYEPQAAEDGTVLKSISKMTMPVSPAKQIVVFRDSNSFKAKEIEKKVDTVIAASRTTLKYSLYGSAAKAGIPDEVIADMIKIFSWSVDFQRDIRSGDEIEILYETKMTEDGAVMGYGDILYARLVTGGQDLSLYRYSMKDGHSDYFDPQGHSIKRTLMKTPIDGARMSSGYGMRRHPVLGYNKMHKGADFAAPTGTPIFAAGDGVIEKAGRNGSFGNYVRIRHNSKLQTAYAHMQKIKSGIRPGTRVKQGQIIGYVGTTGRSTGPHLHYEVLINGTQVNPRGVNVPTGETLSGKELKRFQASKASFDQEFSTLTRPQKYAQADSSEDDVTLR
ncbi:MAG: peptidoglycan DD-metalloendopeptidase family protein [Rhodospirillales bacterium]|nr:peptidoglycan DD-metalloendopeptidase family protein [Rhodospirillales bacterium]